MKITFDPSVISYTTLLTVFFASHDPTSLDKQGGDAGEQYRSVIFHINDEQKKEAEELISTLQNDKTYDQPIVTELRPAEKFRPAEGYHQNYYNQHGSKPYCQIVINPKVQKLREKFKHLLKTE